MDSLESNIKQMEDLNQIKKLIQKVSDIQDGMNNVIVSMDKTLTQLNQTVIGNKLYGQKGLVSEVEDIKKYVNNDKMLKSKLAGGLVVIGVFWTFMLQYFSSFFTFKK